jgi:hypothetical protein
MGRSATRFSLEDDDAPGMLGGNPVVASVGCSIHLSRQPMNTASANNRAQGTNAVRRTNRNLP